MFWGRQPPRTDPALLAALDKIAPAAHQQELLQRVEALERAMKDIRIDWDVTLDKFARLLKRLTKRIDDEEKVTPTEDAFVPPDVAKGRLLAELRARRNA